MDITVYYSHSFDAHISKDGTQISLFTKNGDELISGQDYVVTNWSNTSVINYNTPSLNFTFRFSQ